MLTPGNTKVASSTTADYDPMAPDFKPWRDTEHMLNKPHPKIPGQVGGVGGPNTSPLAPLAHVPWRPTMSTYIHGVDGDKKKRQLEGIKRKELLLKNSNRKLVTEEQLNQLSGRSKASVGASLAGGASVEGTKSVDADGQPIPMANLPAGHHGAVVYFKQHAFQRRHGKRKPAIPKQLDPIALKLREEAEARASLAEEQAMGLQARLTAMEVEHSSLRGELLAAKMRHAQLEERIREDELAVSNLYSAAGGGNEGLRSGEEALSAHMVLLRGVEEALHSAKAALH